MFLIHLIFSIWNERIPNKISFFCQFFEAGGGAEFFRYSFVPCHKRMIFKQLTRKFNINSDCNDLLIRKLLWKFKHGRIWQFLQYKRDKWDIRSRLLNIWHKQRDDHTREGHIRSVHPCIFCRGHRVKGRQVWVKLCDLSRDVLRVLLVLSFRSNLCSRRDSKREFPWVVWPLASQSLPVNWYLWGPHVALDRREFVREVIEDASCYSKVVDHCQNFGLFVWVFQQPIEFLHKARLLQGYVAQKLYYSFQDNARSRPGSHDSDPQSRSAVPTVVGTLKLVCGFLLQLRCISRKIFDNVLFLRQRDNPGCHQRLSGHHYQTFYDWSVFVFVFSHL